MQAITKLFGHLDPRDQNARHDFCELLFIALAAGLCGAKNCTDFARFARESAAPFFRSVDASRADILAALAARSCDLALTMNFPAVLKESFTVRFPLGVVNCHGSLLPRYRGNACPNWAILAGDGETGITLHQVRPGELDNGSILMQRRFLLNDQLDIGDVYRWYEEAIPAAFAELVEALAAGAIAPIPQNEATATFSYPRRADDARLDLSRPAADCLRLIRASSRPFSGAFCTFEGKTRVTVWKASLAPRPGRIFAAAGQVLGVDDDSRPTIWTGDGAIRFDDYEPEAPVSIGRRSRFG